MVRQTAKTRLRAGRDAGFTLIEMMAAVSILFIGTLGMLGMIDQSILNNKANRNITMSSLALQDRLSGFYRLPRQYLTSKGLNTSFTCGNDSNKLGVDLVSLGAPIVEALDKKADGSALPAGMYGFPYTLTMNVYGVCTPDRKDEQGDSRCTVDPTGQAFRGVCPVGQRQIGGMEHNDQTPNTYSVQYTLSDKGTGAVIFGGEFWMSDDPTRFN